jgi:hypothetical protein
MGRPVNGPSGHIRRHLDNNSGDNNSITNKNNPLTNISFVTCVMIQSVTWHPTIALYTIYVEITELLIEREEIYIDVKEKRKKKKTTY